jgi:hypothetical protein
VFPDGFSPLFCPAAALPALLVPPVLAVPPVALPVVVPPVGDPAVVPLVAAPPVAELPPVEPTVDCASAQVPLNANAVANPNVASFMIAPFSWCVTANEVRRRCVPDRGSQFVAVPRDFHRPQFGNRNDALVGSLRQLCVASRYFIFHHN